MMKNYKAQCDTNNGRIFLFGLLELILIVAYLFKSIIGGLLLWLIIMLFVYSNCFNTLDFLIRSLIASIPISFLEINCTPGLHIFKWYNLCILLLQMFLFVKLYSLRFKLCNFSANLVFLTILSIQFLRTILCDDYTSAFIELLQEYITLITLWLFWNYYDQNRLSVDYSLHVNIWLNYYYAMTISCAFGLFFQYMIFIYSGKILGFVTFLPLRQSFDLLFTGFSVLSVLLGSGMIVAMIKIINRSNTTTNIIFFLTLGLACSINSARSGLYSATIIAVLMIILNTIKGKDISLTTLILGIIISVILITTFGVIVSRREALQTKSFVTDNGRFDLLQFGIDLITNSLSNFLFGTGINSGTVYGSQHNMFIEMLVLNGIIFFIGFVYLVCCILYRTRFNETRFIMWYIVLAHQFISSFFASTFLVPIVIIAISSIQMHNSHQQSNFM